MSKGLIIIDVQNDYFEGGAMQLVGMQHAAAHCKLLLEHYRAHDLPIFHIQHINESDEAAFFQAGTSGANIHSSMQPRDEEVHLVKHFPNAFRGTTLQEDLKNRGVDEVVICGAMTHMCIDATTRAAFDLGYACQVVYDACATKDLTHANSRVKALDVHNAFMAALSGTYAKICTTADVVGGL